MSDGGGAAPAANRWAVFWDEKGEKEAVFALERDADTVGRFRLKRRFLYDRLDGTGFVAPRDPETFVTDLASVPSVLTWLVPKDGTHTPAALIHDALICDPALPADYREARWDGGWTTDEKEPADRFSREEADLVFRIAMRQLGVSLLRRWLMWAAVSVGSLVAPTRRLRVRAGWYALLFVLILVLGVGGVAAFLDVIDVQWAWKLPYMGDREWYREIGAYLAAATGIVVVSSLLWHRHWRVGLIFSSALALLAVPVIVSGVTAGLYQVVDAVVYWISKEPPQNAPALVAWLRKRFGSAPA